MLKLAAVLGAFWLLLSGNYSPLFLCFGVLSVLLAVSIARRMDLADRETLPLHLTPRGLTYWPWLGGEIVKSNLDVARSVLDPRLPIERCVVRVPTGGLSSLGKVIYANSVTLTPGTVTLDIDGDELVVHALSRKAADQVVAGEMGRRTAAMTGD